VNQKSLRATVAIAVLGGVLALCGFAAGAAHTEALLLSCMDYRLTDDITRYMDGRGLHDAYDHVVLAGAALGAQTRKHRAWGKTFWEHLDVALQLHHVRRVVLLDHRDCGAYKVLLGEDLAATPERETEVHARHLRDLRRKILARHPGLEVEMLLMALDGSVETVPAG
jgi:carbonic anhydrase